MRPRLLALVVVLGACAHVPGRLRSSDPELRALAFLEGCWSYSDVDWGEAICWHAEDESWIGEESVTGPMAVPTESRLRIARTDVAVRLTATAVHATRSRGEAEMRSTQRSVTARNEST